MTLKSNQLTLDSVILRSLIFVTLTVTPFATLEPFNLPKLFVLTICAFIITGLLAANFKKVHLEIEWKVWVMIISFILTMFIASIFSPNSSILNIYGTPGRNTGYLTYFCLVVLFLAAVFVSKTDFLMKFQRSAHYIGGILLLYGVFQSFKLDIFSYNNVYSSSVIGTFGNPNFMSAYMGIFGTMLFVFYFQNTTAKNKSFLIVVSFALTIYVITATKSIQGFLTLLAGVGIATVFLLHGNGYRRISKVVFMAYALSATLLGAGLLSRGPFSDYLSGPTLVYRRVYWETAFRMMVDHPFFGVGLDNYGEWFRRSRSTDNVNNYGTLYADTAHNVFLDLGAGGGFFLLTVYVAINLFTIYRIFQNILTSPKIDKPFIAISSAWFAYTAQSLISINQIGLAIWGWIFSGLVIGYKSERLNVRKKGDFLVKKKSLSMERISRKYQNTVLVPFILIGLLVASPLFIASVKFRSAIVSGDAVRIQRAAELWPYDKSRFLQVTLILESNNLPAQALNVSTRGIELFPDSFENWEQYSRLKYLSERQQVYAKTQLKRLDPHNPSL